MNHPDPIRIRRCPVFAWRAMTSILIAASFVILAFSGAILFVSPPGRIANWTNWTILGLRKHDWIGLHVWFSLLFLTATFAHVFFNWRPLLNYFRDRLTRRIGFRREWVVALLVCAAVYAGTRAGMAPFSSLLVFSEQVKESWEQPRERAPIPHAELLTFAALAQKTGVDMTTAASRLQAKGITGVTPEIVVQELANSNKRSAQQIYEALAASSGSGPASSGNEKPRGGYGGGGKAGGGPGRKTLQEYCAEESVELTAALARLEARGIKATAALTLREIAVQNGYVRPYEILDIIQAK